MGTPNDDAAAYRHLVETHIDHAYALALRLFPVRAHAEDLVQEVFVAVWEDRRTRPWAHLGFSVWLYREIVNAGMRRHGVLAADPPPTDVISKLPIQHRVALTLLYLPDMDVEKVAAVLGTTGVATEEILMEGRRTLRRHFQATEGVPAALRACS